MELENGPMTSDMIKVKFIGEDDPLMLRTGKIYAARFLKPDRKGNLWYGIIDETNEEYAYPATLFEVIKK